VVSWWKYVRCLDDKGSAELKMVSKILNIVFKKLSQSSKGFRWSIVVSRELRIIVDGL
jgi:hypothetical protein